MPRAATKLLPSQAELRALFDYDPATGVLTWRPRGGAYTRFDGAAAGTVDRAGYVAVGIKTGGKPTYYKAHRIIWKMMTGQEPPEQIDHRDLDRSNNRWRNLRAAANGPNLQNAKLRRDNQSGVKGVSWEADRQKWQAIVSVGKRKIRIGRFDRLTDAEAAVLQARQNLHGEFARAR